MDYCASCLHVVNLEDPHICAGDAGGCPCPGVHLVGNPCGEILNVTYRDVEDVPENPYL